MRSADNLTCLVKRSRNQFGDRCFATAGPTLWNSLPEQFRQPDIIFDRWKRLSLVSWAAAPCVWTVRALTRNLLTYLLILRRAGVLFFVSFVKHGAKTCYGERLKWLNSGNIISIPSFDLKSCLRIFEQENNCLQVENYTSDFATILPGNV